MLNKDSLQAIASCFRYVPTSM